MKGKRLKDYLLTRSSSGLNIQEIKRTPHGWIGGLAPA